MGLGRGQLGPRHGRGSAGKAAAGTGEPAPQLLYTILYIICCLLWESIRCLEERTYLVTCTCMKLICRGGATACKQSKPATQAATPHSFETSLVVSVLHHACGAAAGGNHMLPPARPAAGCSSRAGRRQRLRACRGLPAGAPGEQHALPAAGWQQGSWPGEGAHTSVHRATC
jgi:hypothetical protein